MKKIALVLVVLLVLGGVGFAWYYFYGPCGTLKVSQANEEIKKVIDDFSQGVDIASSTPRGSLSDQIVRLQSIQDDFQDIEVPACMDTADKLLDDAMSTTINAFVMFLGQATDSDVNNEMNSGASQVYRAQDELQTVYECAPFCKADPYKRTP